MKVISLYDYTTIMLKPWAEAGHECYSVDLQHTTATIGNIFTLSLDVTSPEVDELCQDASIIFAFPPCDDLAVSGAAHFKKKGPERRQQAMTLVYAAYNLAVDADCPYMIENPISVISSEWRKPDWIFDPFEYGGYLPENHASEMPRYIPHRDAYQKRTCLWVGQGFIIPDTKPVDYIRYKYPPAHLYLGGSSKRTKNIRSRTPEGFALAVYEANCK